MENLSFFVVSLQEHLSIGNFSSIEMKILFYQDLINYSKACKIDTISCSKPIAEKLCNLRMVQDFNS